MCVRRSSCIDPCTPDGPDITHPVRDGPALNTVDNSEAHVIVGYAPRAYPTDRCGCHAHGSAWACWLNVRHHVSRLPTPQRECGPLTRSSHPNPSGHRSTPHLNLLLVHIMRTSGMMSSVANDADVDAWRVPRSSRVCRNTPELNCPLSQRFLAPYPPHCHKGSWHLIPPKVPGALFPSLAATKHPKTHGTLSRIGYSLSAGA